MRVPENRVFWVVQVWLEVNEDLADGVAHVQLHQPDAHNAPDVDTTIDLKDALTSAT